MAYLEDAYIGETAATSSVDERVSFIRKTYLHLFFAIAALIGIEAALFSTGAAKDVLVSMGGVAWIGVMVLFIGGGYLAQYLARNGSKPVQYVGLMLEVGIWAVMLLPILYVAEVKFPGKHLAEQAAILTLVVFGGLTATVFLTKKDFSFLGQGLTILSFVALGLVVLAACGLLNLGIWFSFAMVALSAGTILYSTSNLMYHYPTTAYVAAALELFGSVALLFFYVLRILMATASND